jgi:octaprenyl-diphosphate synthase
MEKVLKLIENDLRTLEVAIDKMVTTRIDLIKHVVTHIIRSGGKRVRPILVILTSRLCGYEGEGHIPYAAIIEFIHTSTLLHDDVVDNAPTRRGSLSANALWGNEASVLVGDFLFSKSFDLMVEGQNLDLLRVVSQTTTALAEGEILELVHTSDADTTEDQYFDVITNKTAVLFSAACEMGAILGASGAADRENLRRFGHHLGLAFQLIDDVLDYTSRDDVLGKHVGTDLEEGKVTLPLIHALRSATHNERTRIASLLQKPKVSARDFAGTKKIIERYGGLEYTLASAKNHTARAMERLEAFTPSPYREALMTLTSYIVERNL